jgi:acetyl-CoA carboxylase biotin carboxyl carrier protein
MELTNADVADILALLDSLPYDSLDLETPRFRLTLRRAPGGGWTEESQVLAEPSEIPAAPDSAPAPSGATADISGTPGGPAPNAAASDAGADGLAAGAEAADGLVVVPAPLPGTFYRAPRPGADPFVQVGDVVSPDTVVAIVETMKLMNSVPAGTAGRVSRICLENGELAAAGDTLMLIEPDT